MKVVFQFYVKGAIFFENTCLNDILCYMIIEGVKSFLIPFFFIACCGRNMRGTLSSSVVFCSITKERTEVIFQGTHDHPSDPDAEWLEYEFKCKPGGYKHGELNCPFSFITFMLFVFGIVCLLLFFPFTIES